MTTVKHFHSAMVGAPVITGAAGTLISVLDACLVTGFGLKTLDSLVVSGNVATLSVGSGHSFEPDTIALIAGATPAGLNGEKRILSTTLNTATFAAPGVSDQTATGTITARLAPAGWAKSFTGTSLAAYRAVDPSGTRMFLRVDDTSNTNARVLGYETMSDVSTGVGPFPTDTQVSGGGWWPKATGTAGSARAWTLISDNKGFWLHLQTTPSSPGSSGAVWGFGDFSPLKSGDPYACTLVSTQSNVATATSVSNGSLEYLLASPTFNTAAFAPRSFTALGGSSALINSPDFPLVNTGTSGSLSSSSTPLFGNYPNPADNSLILRKKILSEAGVSVRGYTRGAFLTPLNCHAAFNWRDKIDGQGEYAGRKLMAIKCGAPASGSSQGVIFIDITGPWA